MVGKRNTGIPTKYAGVQFRSRLEARWAATFDLMGWRWEYEPLDLAGWIPDFGLYMEGVNGSEWMALVEVKPIRRFDPEIAAEVAKAVRGTREEATSVILLGATLDPSTTGEEVGDELDGMGAGEVMAGWLGYDFDAICREAGDALPNYPKDKPEPDWFWHGLVITPSFDIRQRGQPDHPSRTVRVRDATPGTIRDHWLAAGNLTQWTGRR